MNKNENYFINIINEISPNLFNKKRKKNKENLRKEIEFNQDYILIKKSKVNLLNLKNDKKQKLDNKNQNVFKKLVYYIDNSKFYNFIYFLAYFMYIYLSLIINYNKFEYFDKNKVNKTFILFTYILYSIFFIFEIIKNLILIGLKDFFFKGFKNKLEFFLIIFYFVRSLYFLQSFRIFILINKLTNRIVLYLNFNLVSIILKNLISLMIICLFKILLIIFIYSVFYLNLFNFYYLNNSIENNYYEDNKLLNINNNNTNFNLRNSFFYSFDMIINNSIFNFETLDNIKNINIFIFIFVVFIKELFFLIVNFIPLIIMILNYKKLLLLYHKSIDKSKINDVLNFNLLVDITNKWYKNDFNNTIKNSKITEFFEKIFFSNYYKIFDYIIIIIYFILLNIYLFYFKFKSIQYTLFSINILSLSQLLFLLFFIKISKHLTQKTFMEELILSIIIFSELLYFDFSYFYIFKLFKIFIILKNINIKSIVDLLKNSINLVFTLLLMNLILLIFLTILLKYWYSDINFYYLNNGINSYPIIFSFTDNINTIISVLTIIYSVDWIYLYNYFIIKNDNFKIAILIIIILIFRIIFLNYWLFIIFINFKYGVHKIKSQNFFLEIYKIKKETIKNKNKIVHKNLNNKIAPKIKNFNKSLNLNKKKNDLNKYNITINKNDINYSVDKNNNWDKNFDEIKESKNIKNKKEIDIFENYKEVNNINFKNEKNNDPEKSKSYLNNEKSSNLNYNEKSCNLNYSFLIKELTNIKYIEDEIPIENNSIFPSKNNTIKRKINKKENKIPFLYKIQNFKIKNNKKKENEIKFGKFFNSNFYFILINYLNSNNKIFNCIIFIIFLTEIFLYNFDIINYNFKLAFLIIYLIEFILRIITYFVDYFILNKLYKIKLFDIFFFNGLLNIVANILLIYYDNNFIFILKILKILNFLFIIKIKKNNIYYKILDLILFKSYIKFVIFIIITFFSLFILSIIYFVFYKNKFYFCIKNNNLLYNFNKKNCLRNNGLWIWSDINFINPINSLLNIFGILRGFYINTILSTFNLNNVSYFQFFIIVLMILILVIIIKYYLLNILINYYENYFYLKEIKIMWNQNNFVETKNYFEILNIIDKKEFIKIGSKKENYWEIFIKNKIFNSIIILLNLLNLIIWCLINNKNKNYLIFIIFEIFFIIIFNIECIIYLISLRNKLRLINKYNFLTILNLIIIILFILKYIGYLKFYINSLYLIRIIEFIYFLNLTFKNFFLKCFIFINENSFKIILKFLLLGIIFKLFLTIFFRLSLKINFYDALKIVINMTYLDNYNYLILVVKNNKNKFFFYFINILFNVIINIIITTIFLINIINSYFDFKYLYNSSINKLINKFFLSWNEYDLCHKGIIAPEDYIDLIGTLQKNLGIDFKINKNNFKNYKKIIESLKPVNLPVYKYKNNDKFYIHFIDICHLIISKLMEIQYYNLLKNMDCKLYKKISNFWMNKFNNLNEFEFKFLINNNKISYYWIDYISIRYIESHYKLNINKTKEKIKKKKNQRINKNNKIKNKKKKKIKTIKLPNQIFIEDYIEENQITKNTNKLLLKKNSSFSEQNISNITSIKKVNSLIIKKEEKSFSDESFDILEENNKKINIRSYSNIDDIEINNSLELEFDKIKYFDS